MPTIQIWIDLWTTNSAIAINKSGKTEIIKNFERDEFTPSVYWFDKAKNPLVWKRAYGNFINMQIMRMFEILSLR